MGNIRQLDFGEISAERERDFLTTRIGFVTTPQFESLVKGTSHLFVGRKGDGKTALRYAFLERSYRAKAITIDLSFTGLSAELFFRLVARCAHVSGADLTTLLRNMWRFLIGLRLMQEALTAPKLASAWSNPEHHPALHRCRVYTESLKTEPSTGATNLLKVAQYCADHIEQFVERNSRAAVQDNFPTDADFRAAETALISVLDTYGGASVIVDDLDPWVEQVRFEKVEAFVVSLISATEALRSTYSPRALDVRLLLPQCTFTAISFRHRDKITHGHVRLTWNSSRLKALVARRIAVSLKIRKGQVWSDEVDKIFARILEPRLTVYDLWWQRQVPAFAFIFFHSQYTARDVLFCFSQIRNKALAGGRDPDTFSASDIREGVRAACLEATERTINEYSVRFPAPRDVIKEFTGCHAQLSYKDALTHVEESGRATDDGLTPPECLSILYEMGFLGKYQRSPGVAESLSGGESFGLYYAHTRPDPDFYRKDRLLIHPMFWERYGIVPPMEPLKSVKEPA